MTTAKQMLPVLGAHVLVRFEDLTVECWIKDVKNAWGKPRLLIVPVTGTGEQWVELGRVTLPVAEKPKSAGVEIANMRRSIQSIL